MQDEFKGIKRIGTDLEPTLKLCRGLSLLKLPFVPNQPFSLNLWQIFAVSSNFESFQNKLQSGFEKHSDY